MDALSREIELTARHLVMLDAEPGWQEQVAHRIAELKREPWFPQLRARINELRSASSSQSEPSTRSTTGSTGSSAPAGSETSACTRPSRSTAKSVRRSRAS